MISGLSMSGISAAQSEDQGFDTFFRFLLDRTSPDDQEMFRIVVGGVSNFSSENREALVSVIEYYNFSQKTIYTLQAQILNWHSWKKRKAALAEEQLMTEELNALSKRVRSDFNNQLIKK